MVPGTTAPSRTSRASRSTKGVEVEVPRRIELSPVSSGDEEARDLAAERRRGRPVEATENESPCTKERGGRGASMVADGGGRNDRSWPGLAGDGAGGGVLACEQRRGIVR